MRSGKTSRKILSLDILFSHPQTKPIMTDQEARKIDVEIANLMATTAKLNAETDKISRENHYYPAIVGASVTLAIVALVKVFL